MNEKLRRPKIAIIGAGQIGGTLALLIAQNEVGSVVMVDIAEGLPQGKALDLMEAMPIEGINAHIKGTNTYEDIADADVCVITAGIPRKPGMSREDLLDVNAKIIKAVASNIKQYAPNSYVIALTNPLDAMVYLLYRLLGFPRNRIMGMAGVLDSARFRAFIAETVNVSPKDVVAFVLGSHGDLMLPLARYSHIAGIPLLEYPGITQEIIDKLVERTKNAGGEIVNLLKKGSAFYGPAYSAFEMLKAILNDEKRILPCAVYLDGEYGHKGIFIGVPVKLGINGVEEIIEVKLTSSEREAFNKSADAVKKLVNEIEEKYLK
jgi:malate dehydrogenase